MTCVVAIKDGQRVIIGADSAGVNTQHMIIHPEKNPKVFQKGEFVMGYTSSFRMGQILMYHFDPPIIPENTDLTRYMVVDFIKALRACHKDQGFLSNNAGVESGCGNFIVGIRGRIFEIEDNFQVMEPDRDYCSVGCGMDYAYGSLITSQYVKDPKKRVLMALAAASEFSTGVRAPFLISITPRPKKRG